MTDDLCGRPLSPKVPEQAWAFARGLARAGGGNVLGVILYGSQLQRSSPGLFSAWDLVIVVDEYPGFHSAMKAAGHRSRPLVLMNVLGHILPPYVTDFSPEEADGGIAKCLVLTLDQLQRALGPGAPDHFVKGRLVQHVEVVWAASEGDEARITGALAAARQDVIAWVGPYLPERFDAGSFTLTMLRVSFAGEIRPESRERVREVWGAQEEWLVDTYTAVLEAACAGGRVVVDPAGGFRLSSRPGRWSRLGLKAYFFWSKVRGTARWGKHMVTFNDWLTYIQRKAERRTGLTIELTRRERRWPLIFLWPRLFRVLRYARTATPDREGPP